MLAAPIHFHTFDINGLLFTHVFLNYMLGGKRSSGRASKDFAMGSETGFAAALQDRRCLAVLGGLFLLLIIRSSGYGGDVVGSSSGDEVYGVMFDAGSTGSRVHAYRFRKSGGQLMLVDELFEQLKPGLSSFKSDADGAAQSIVPLLNSAIGKVPEGKQASTPVNVKATAGLRMLGETEANAILASTRTLLEASPFHFNRGDGVEIMGGLDEAFFAWVTVNYLEKWLEKATEETAVMLDLGGGSTQIAMSVPRSRGNVGAALIDKTILGKTHGMFLHSYLGYGLMAGRSGVFGVGVPKGDARRSGSEPLSSPCLPKGSSASFAYNADSWKLEGAASAEADDCLKLAIKYLMSSKEFSDVEQGAPSPAPGQPVFAMSYYFDVAEDIGLIAKGRQEAKLHPADYSMKRKVICGRSKSELQMLLPNADSERVAFLCTDLSFIEALLINGFKLDPEAQMTLAKSITFNGARVETQWTLGAAIEEIGKLA